MKKLILIFTLLTTMSLVSCTKSEAKNESEGLQATSNVESDATTEALLTTATSAISEAKYDSEGLQAIASAIQRLLYSEFSSVGVDVNCYPTLEDDSVLLVFIMSTIDTTAYTKDELQGYLESYSIEEVYSVLPSSILESYELKNVVISVNDKNGDLLYVFHNEETLFRYGDEGYNLDITLITPKT